MKAQIGQQLRLVEQQEQVRILFACESGSRAWGFPSSDSDYDVRFLYLHPRSRYLRLDSCRMRGVIERPLQGNIDLSGWDLRKTLNLLLRSNAPLFEWLGSPVVYRAEPAFADRLRKLSSACYSPRAAAYHYLHLAKRSLDGLGSQELVKIKTYFYVLRPLLSVLWLERGMGIVPTEFLRLVETVAEPALQASISSLLKRKEGSSEKDRLPRIDPLDDFIEREMDRLSRQPLSLPDANASPEPLNALFQDTLKEVGESLGD